MAGVHCAIHTHYIFEMFLRRLYDSKLAQASYLIGCQATGEAILAFSTHLDHDQACGATPINGLLAAARRRRLSVELLDLRNSGDTAGDRNRVVGYASFAFAESSASGADRGDRR